MGFYWIAGLKLFKSFFFKEEIILLSIDTDVNAMKWLKILALLVLCVLFAGLLLSNNREIFANEKFRTKRIYALLLSALSKGSEDGVKTSNIAIQ